jgi:hypothetical protein
VLLECKNTLVRPKSGLKSLQLGLESAEISFQSLQTFQEDLNQAKRACNSDEKREEDVWVNICQPAKGRNYGFSDSTQIFFGDSLYKL